MHRIMNAQNIVGIPNGKMNPVFFVFGFFGRTDALLVAGGFRRARGGGGA